MADLKISQLTAYTTPIAGDVLPIVDTTTNTAKKITRQDLIPRRYVVSLVPGLTTPATTNTLACYYAVTGSGAVTNSSGGWQLATSTTDGSSTRVIRKVLNGGDTLDWDNNPEYSTVFQVSANTAGSAVIAFLIGNNGSEPTSAGVLTNKHVGFIIGISGGTQTVYASNANGTTQTKTNVTASYTDSNRTSFAFTVTSGVNIKFYIDGVLVATHTTNMPTGALAQTSDIWNDLDAGTTSGSTIIWYGDTFSTDM